MTLKISEVSSIYHQMTYGNLTCEKCGVTYNPIHKHTCINLKPFTQEQMDKVNEEMKKMWYCKCGVELNSIHNGLCWKCKEEKQEIEKQKYLMNRRYTVSLEDRITEIESWIYDHKQNHPQKEWLMK